MIASATDPLDCNSYWAQGGIIYKGKEDSRDLLAQDIKYAGSFKCDDSAVDHLTNCGPASVDELLIQTAKVPFDKDSDGNLSLCLEASHNRPRIIHWKDHTGKAITEHIQQAVHNSPNIELVCGTTAVDLAISQGPTGNCCVGVHAIKSNGELVTFLASATVLATGGLGDIYENTSNPKSARGDGFALAMRAGASLKDMEYVQFHPTTLFIPGERRFLLTEALRGQGARLFNTNGERFAHKYHELEELAPRDVVSRMIVEEMKITCSDHVLLDISHLPAKFLVERFPSIYKYCLERGFDLTKDRIPVVPAAHYFCGGVQADVDGKTNLPGLFAAGEVSCTGLHGANRLASTSLLEGLVWGRTIGTNLVNFVASRQEENRTAEPFLHYGNQVPDKNEVSTLLDKLRKTMWENVGVVRSKETLTRALKDIMALKCRADDVYHRSRLTPETVNLRNAVSVGAVIVQAALRNKASVGCHFRTDGVVFPYKYETNKLESDAP